MKNVIKTVLVKKIKQYRFLIKYRVEKRNNSGIENNGSGNYKIKKEYKKKEIEFSIYVKEEDYKKRNCVY